jgi:sterol desaturase/sphingolipid hydroxylase (fatty acid hydroxylase superfamily)
MEWLPTLIAGCGLAVMWVWETVAPYIVGRTHRRRHALRNLGLALLNAFALTLLLGTATSSVLARTAQHEFGMLYALPLTGWGRLPVAVGLLDGWLYLWHRLVHRIPLLWRLHRVHHIDGEMDVTTAVRFHAGEFIVAAVIRLGMLAIFGISLGELLVFQTLVLAVTMFHHANISLGSWDRPLRWFLVTPYMHQIHHSQKSEETNSNYATLSPWWDRIFSSYQMRSDQQPVELGLVEFTDPRWQTIGGMLVTPFTTSAQASPPSKSFPP